MSCQAIFKYINVMADNMIGSFVTGVLSMQLRPCSSDPGLILTLWPYDLHDVCHLCITDYYILKSDGNTRAVQEILGRKVFHTWLCSDLDLELMTFKIVWASAFQHMLLTCKASTSDLLYFLKYHLTKKCHYAIITQPPSTHPSSSICHPRASAAPRNSHYTDNDYFKITW